MVNVIKQIEKYLDIVSNSNSLRMLFAITTIAIPFVIGILIAYIFTR